MRSLQTLDGSAQGREWEESKFLQDAQVVSWEQALCYTKADSQVLSQFWFFLGGPAGA